MPTVVPSKNDLDKLLAKDAQLEAAIADLRQRVTALEAGAAPPAVEEPPVEIPPAPEPEPAPLPPQSGDVQPGPYRFTRMRPFDPPAVVRTPQELMAARLVPPIDASLITKFFQPIAYEPPKWLGFDGFGGDEEAAIVTNESAQWLAGGDPRNMLAWADSHGMLPIHWIDPDTGRLWNIQEKPRTSTYYKTATFDGTSDSPVKPETAHYRSHCYVPYLATRDAFYLEELQFAANFHILALNSGYRLDDTGKIDLGLFNRHQMRAWAWHLRDTVLAYFATVEAEKAGPLPAPLLPSSYWKWIIDNNRDWVLAKWVNAPHAASGLRMFPIFDYPTTIAPWQQDWAGAVIGWMIWTGRFDDWRLIYEWQIRQAIDRTSGQSGFPRSQAIGYWWQTAGATDMASLAALNGLVETADGNFPAGFNKHYAESLRANLKIATLNGVPGADECFAYVNTQLPVPPDAKWAI